MFIDTCSGKMREERSIALGGGIGEVYGLYYLWFVYVWEVSNETTLYYWNDINRV